MSVPARDMDLSTRPGAPAWVTRFAPVDGVEDAGLLTAAERERRDRLHRADDRAAFVAAHVLVRECAARLLGIDVEPLRPIAPIAAVLTEAERAWIADQTDPSAAFLRLWVRKEALVKAGFGSLNDPLSLDALTPPVPVTDWTDGRAVGAFAHAAS